MALEMLDLCPSARPVPVRASNPFLSFFARQAPPADCWASIGPEPDGRQDDDEGVVLGWKALPSDDDRVDRLSIRLHNRRSSPLYLRVLLLLLQYGEEELMVSH